MPVVPAYVAGAFEALPRHRRLPRPHRVTVTFGTPLPPDALGRYPAEITAEMRDAVAGLAPKA